MRSPLPTSSPPRPPPPLLSRAALCALLNRAAAPAAFVRCTAGLSGAPNALAHSTSIAGLARSRPRPPAGRGRGRQWARASWQPGAQEVCGSDRDGRTTGPRRARRRGRRRGRARRAPSRRGARRPAVGGCVSEARKQHRTKKAEAQTCLVWDLKNGSNKEATTPKSKKHTSASGTWLPRKRVFAALVLACSWRGADRWRGGNRSPVLFGLVNGGWCSVDTV